MRGDEGTFRRWVAFELGTLHAGLVSQRRLLADLLQEAQPSAPARGGTHAFEPRELRALAERLPTELRYALRLPIHLYTDGEVADALYAQDPASAEALALLGYAAARPDARGRVWVARSLASQAVRDWPTSVQFVYL